MKHITEYGQQATWLSPRYVRPYNFVKNAFYTKKALYTLFAIII